MSGTSTVAPSGTAAATGASICDTWAPTATSAAVDADQPGERLPGPAGGTSQPSQDVAAGPPVGQRRLQRVPRRARAAGRSWPC